MTQPGGARRRTRRQRGGAASRIASAEKWAAALAEGPTTPFMQEFRGVPPGLTDAVARLFSTGQFASQPIARWLTLRRVELLSHFDKQGADAVGALLLAVVRAQADRARARMTIVDVVDALMRAYRSAGARYAARDTLAMLVADLAASDTRSADGPPHRDGEAQRPLVYVVIDVVVLTEDLLVTTLNAIPPGPARVDALDYAAEVATRYAEDAARRGRDDPAHRSLLAMCEAVPGGAFAVQGQARFVKPDLYERPDMAAIAEAARSAGDAEVALRFAAARRGANAKQGVKASEGAAARRRPANAGQRARASRAAAFATRRSGVRNVPLGANGNANSNSNDDVSALVARLATSAL
jgi:hypothetical protein